MRRDRSSTDGRADGRTDGRTRRISEALRMVAERRDHLAEIRAAGQPGAGAEALYNGALRHAIRLSNEAAQVRRGVRPHPLSRRQMDRIMHTLAERGFPRI